MDTEALKTRLSQYKGAQSGYPFGPDALVYKVMGKMFALLAEKDEPPRLTLKCPPADGENLVNQFSSVIPGYYMNKKHWITLSLNGELTDGMILDLVDGSYQLVVNKLTTSEKRLLLEN
jgi:predicted DNA-binding protein (MmcQ/YjbR family)